MAAIKFDLKNIMTRNALPGGDNPAGRGKAAPFTAFYCRDDKSLWISDAEGNLVSLSDLLSSDKVRVAGPGPQGKPGVDGKDGRDGVDGRDGEPGPAGDKGERGDFAYIGAEEIKTAADKIRAEHLAHRARFRAAIEQTLDDAKQLGGMGRLVTAHVKTIQKRTEG